MPNFPPTDEQQACIDFAAARSAGSLMIDAGAGCAKSTTLEMMAPRLRQPALLCAFNKRNVKEAEGKFPPNFTLKTQNGLGHGALARLLGKKPNELKLDDDKLSRIQKAVLEDFHLSRHLSGDQWAALRTMVREAMQRGILPEGMGQSFSLGDTEEGWREVADAQLMDDDDFRMLLDPARAILRAGVQEALQGTISFADQIYCSVLLGGHFWKYPIVFVDERQDLNPLNIEIVKRSLLPGGRLVAVGDNKQAIYAWRGAAGDADARYEAAVGGRLSSLPLLTTFRCPKVIVERQQEHVPGFRAAPTNREGTVVRLGASGSGWDFSSLMALAEGHCGPGTQPTIICRNNGPLLSMAFKLIRSGISCHVLGRDIGKNLQALLRKLCPQDITTADIARGKIADWRSREITKLLANNKESLVSGVEDRAECLYAVLDSASDVGQAQTLLERLFSADHGRVLLTSGHRAKGGEWDCVVHLDPWRVPSRHAKKAAAAGDPGPLQQERNLKYVIETRTKNLLVLADLEGFEV